MSCPYFAKEVSYLVRAPHLTVLPCFCSPNTMHRPPGVGSLLLPGCSWWKVYFLWGFFFKFIFLLCELSIQVSSLLQHRPALGPNEWSTWSSRSWSFGSRGKEQLCVSNTWNPECCRGRARTWGRWQAAACAVQKRPRQAPSFSTCALVSQHHLCPHIRHYLLHFAPEVKLS